MVCAGRNGGALQPEQPDPKCSLSHAMPCSPSSRTPSSPGWLVGQILFLCLWDQLVWMLTITITQVEPLAVMTDEQRQEAAAKRDLESQHLQCEVVFPGAVQRWGLANDVLMLYER